MTGLCPAAAQAHALRAAAALIERAGIAGLSVSVDAADISILVPDFSGPLAQRQAAVEQLAATAGARAARRDYPASPILGVIRADGSEDGHPVSIFTVIRDSLS
jgi:hypothetical protein